VIAALPTVGSLGRTRGSGAVAMGRPRIRLTAVGSSPARPNVVRTALISPAFQQRDPRSTAPEPSSAARGLANQSLRPLTDGSVVGLQPGALESAAECSTPSGALTRGLCPRRGPRSPDGAAFFGLGTTMPKCSGTAEMEVTLCAARDTVRARLASMAVSRPSLASCKRSSCSMIASWYPPVRH